MTYKIKLLLTITFLLLIIVLLSFLLYILTKDIKKNETKVIDKSINITYKKGPELTVTIDSNKMTKTDGYVTDLSVKTSADKKLYLYLKIVNVNESLLNGNLKWQLDKNNSFYSTGDFYNYKNGNNVVLVLNEKITNTDTYKLYIWNESTLSSKEKLHFKFMTGEDFLSPN